MPTSPSPCFESVRQILKGASLWHVSHIYTFIQCQWLAWGYPGCSRIHPMLFGYNANLWLHWIIMSPRKGLWTISLLHTGISIQPIFASHDRCFQLQLCRVEQIEKEISFFWLELLCEECSTNAKGSVALLYGEAKFEVNCKSVASMAYCCWLIVKAVAME